VVHGSGRAPSTPNQIAIEDDLAPEQPEQSSHPDALHAILDNRSAPFWPGNIDSTIENVTIDEGLTGEEADTAARRVVGHFSPNHESWSGSSRIFDHPGVAPVDTKARGQREMHPRCISPDTDCRYGKD
jgi:hypothetical protein